MTNASLAIGNKYQVFSALGPDKKGGIVGACHMCIWLECDIMMLYMIHKLNKVCKKKLDRV